VIAVFNWLLAHWFLLFLLSAFGVFEGVRDFFTGIAQAVSLAGERRHKRRMKELRLRARIAEGAVLPRPAGQGSAPGPCVHRNVVPVVSAAEEVVAWLCRSCETRLPADWAVREEDL
jgi:hypothetical protein